MSSAHLSVLQSAKLDYGTVQESATTLVHDTIPHIKMPKLRIPITDLDNVNKRSKQDPVSFFSLHLYSFQFLYFLKKHFVVFSRDIKAVSSCTLQSIGVYHCRIHSC